jgi:hypothetical protein
MSSWHATVDVRSGQGQDSLASITIISKGDSFVITRLLTASVITFPFRKAAAPTSASAPTSSPASAPNSWEHVPKTRKLGEHTLHADVSGTLNGLGGDPFSAPYEREGIRSSSEAACEELKAFADKSREEHLREGVIQDGDTEPKDCSKDIAPS